MWSAHCIRQLCWKDRPRMLDIRNLHETFIHFAEIFRETCGEYFLILHQQLDSFHIGSELDDSTCFIRQSVKHALKILVAPERIWKCGEDTRLARSAGNFFCRDTPLFGSSLQVQLVAVVSDFVMVSTAWSVSCLLFFYSRCPPCPAICSSGGGGTFPCFMYVLSFDVNNTVRMTLSCDMAR